LIACTNEGRHNTNDSIVEYCMTIRIIILNTHQYKWQTCRSNATNVTTGVSRFSCRSCECLEQKN